MLWEIVHQMALSLVGQISSLSSGQQYMIHSRPELDSDAVLLHKTHTLSLVWDLILITRLPVLLLHCFFNRPCERRRKSSPIETFSATFFQDGHILRREASVVQSRP